MAILRPPCLRCRSALWHSRPQKLTPPRGFKKAPLSVCLPLLTQFGPTLPSCPIAPTCWKKHPPARPHFFFGKFTPTGGGCYGQAGGPLKNAIFRLNVGRGMPYLLNREKSAPPESGNCKAVETVRFPFHRETENTWKTRGRGRRTPKQCLVAKTSDHRWRQTTTTAKKKQHQKSLARDGLYGESAAASLHTPQGMVFPACRAMRHPSNVTAGASKQHTGVINPAAGGTEGYLELPPQVC